MIKQNEEPSRRDVIRWSALTSTGALVAACSSSPSASGPGTLTDAGTDAANANAAAVPLLNALLSAEWAAIATYAAGAAILSSPPSGDPLASSAPVFLAVATHFQAQHTAHAGALVSAVNALGGTAVAQSAVSFTAPTGFSATVTNVLKLAANAEKAAVSLGTAIVLAERCRSRTSFASLREASSVTRRNTSYSSTRCFKVSRRRGRMFPLARLRSRRRTSRRRSEPTWGSSP